MNDNIKTKSVEKTFAIVEELREREGNGAGVSELTDAVDIPKSTVHRHLSTLNELGYVTKQGDRYHIGARFLYIGSMVRHREEIFDEIHSKIIDLAEETKERAQFMIKEHGHMVYIHQEEGENAVRTNTQLGKQMPLHATSGGKAILSELPTNRVEAIIEQHGLPEITENTITSKEEIFQEFEEIRNRGFSFNDEEYIMGLHSVSVPITKPSGIPVGAIGVSGPSHRLKGETYRSDIPDLLLGIVNEIELNMRYS